MSNDKALSEKEEEQISQILESMQKNMPMDNYQKPNIQFIQRGVQLNRRSFELVYVLENLRDTLKIQSVKSISTKTGIGFLINTESLDISHFNRDTFVEVMDFDPVRNNMMVIGNEPPAENATLHWFMYRGLKNINGIMIIEDEKYLKYFQMASLPTITNQDEILNLNVALEILKMAKDSNITVLNCKSIRGILVFGKTLKDAYDLFERNVKKYAPSNEF